MDSYMTLIGMQLTMYLMHPNYDLVTMMYSTTVHVNMHVHDTQKSREIHDIVHVLYNSVFRKEGGGALDFPSLTQISLFKLIHVYMQIMIHCTCVYTCSFTVL